MNKKTVRDIDVRNKRVLVRVDLNVPIDAETGNITDETRIRAIVPTIKYLVGNEAKVILCSHLGRPKGQVIEPLRLWPVAERLSRVMGKKVKVTHDCIGHDVSEAVAGMKAGDILLLENLRFHSGEEDNDDAFARSLAGLADIYVNDAFGVAHRAHASTVGVTRYLPAVAGFLLEKEIDMLHRELDVPARPFTAVVGGAKVSDKISLIDHMLDKVDNLLIGGGMVSTFLLASGYEVGKSLIERDKCDLAASLMNKAKKKGINLVLPVDLVVADRFDKNADSKTVSISGIPADWMVMDIGPETIEVFIGKLKSSKTVMWNGPMGVFEFPAFGTGTNRIAETIAAIDATTVISGGSSAEAVERMGLTSKVTHVSTGGGASLKLLEGSILPGLDALLDKD